MLPTASISKKSGNNPGSKLQLANPAHTHSPSHTGSKLQLAHRHAETITHTPNPGSRNVAAGVNFQYACRDGSRFTPAYYLLISPILQRILPLCGHRRISFSLSDYLESAS